VKEKYEFGETTVTDVVSDGVQVMSSCHATVKSLALF
jgi:hypothetical protein